MSRALMWALVSAVLSWSSSNVGVAGKMTALSRRHALGAGPTDSCFLRPTTPAPCVSVPDSPDEHSALRALYNTTLGEQWTVRSGWHEDSASVCCWFGVSCDAQGRVVALSLYDNGLAGQLPGDLFQRLPSLQCAWLYQNQITGPPPSLVLPPGAVLARVSLSVNQLSGTFAADAWSSIPSLAVLDLSDNRLTGPIPSLSGLPLLRLLDLSDNGLSGSVPDFAHTPLLVSCDLLNNSLTGPMTVQGLQRLRWLSVERNALSGSLVLRDLPSLALLDVSNNDFSGAFPSCEGLTALTSLRGINNWFSGSIPLFALPALFDLRLNANNFTGALPDFTHCPALQYIDVSDNALTGWPAVGPAVVSVRLDRNKIDVQFTATTNCTTTAPSLALLSVAYNMIGGDVLETLLCVGARYPRIGSLDLSSNRLNVTNMTLLSGGYSRALPALTILNLANNSLTHAGQLLALMGRHWPMVVDAPVAPVISLLNVIDNPFGVARGLPAFVPSATESFVHPQTGLECPVWQSAGDADRFGMVYPPDMTRFALCNCSSGTAHGPTLHFHPALQYCLPCPSNCACNASAESAAAGTSISVNRGYWPYYTVNGSYCASFVDAVNVTARTLANISTAPCPIPTACNPDGAFVFACAKGYRADSRLCSRCEPHWFPVQYQCVQCTAGYVSVVVLVGLVGGPVLFLAFVALQKVPRVAQRVSAIVSIGLFWLQLDSQLADNDYLAGADTGSSLTQYTTAMGVQQLLLVRPYALECVWNDADWVTYFSMTYTLAAAAWAVVAITNCVRDPAHDRYLRPDRPHSCRSRTAYGAHFILDLAYFPLSVSILQAFQCDALPRGDHTYMRAAPYVSCHSAEYTAVVVFAWIGVVLFVAGWPAYCWLQLNSNADRVHRELGFLSESLPRDMRRWSVLWIVRKFLLALVLAVVPGGNVLMPILTFVLLFVGVLLVMHYKPYHTLRDNQIEVVLVTLALAVYQIDISAGLGARFFGASVLAGVRTALAVVVGIVKLCLIVAMAHFFYADICGDSNAAGAAAPVAGDDNRYDNGVGKSGGRSRSVNYDHF